MSPTRIFHNLIYSDRQHNNADPEVFQIWLHHIGDVGSLKFMPRVMGHQVLVHLVGDELTMTNSVSTFKQYLLN